MNEQAQARLHGMLGLARRAGRLTFGFDAVVQDVAKGRARAVLLARDASERTKRGAAELATRTGTPRAGAARPGTAQAGADGAAQAGALPVRELPLGKEEFGRAIGRGETAVAAVTDKGFADQILELVGENPRKEGDLS